MAGAPIDERHAQIGHNIRRLADERGLPLSHLADRVGTARSHLWCILDGTRSPTVRWLSTVAAELDVKIEDLLHTAN